MSTFAACVHRLSTAASRLWATVEINGVFYVSTAYIQTSFLIDGIIKSVLVYYFNAVAWELYTKIILVMKLITGTQNKSRWNKRFLLLYMKYVKHINYMSLIPNSWGFATNPLKIEVKVIFSSLMSHFLYYSCSENPVQCLCTRYLSQIYSTNTTEKHMNSASCQILFFWPRIAFHLKLIIFSVFKFLYVTTLVISKQWSYLRSVTLRMDDFRGQKK